MAGLADTKAVRRAIVYYEDDDDVCGGDRWFDAIGPNVAKFVTEFDRLPADDSTTDPTEFECTVVEVGAGVSTAVLGDVAGGGLVITTAASENDGWSMQLGNPNTGEWVSFAESYSYCYFGTELAIDDVDATDLFVGLAVTNTALLGGVTDGMYFRSVDATGVTNFVIEKNSVESSTAVTTMTDNTYVTLEFFVDMPAGYVYAYVDGALAASVATSDASFPNDEYLRLSVEFLTGDDSANVCTMKWLRLIQIR